MAELLQKKGRPILKDKINKLSAKDMTTQKMIKQLPKRM